jgi:hypothetical protein
VAMKVMTTATAIVAPPNLDASFDMGSPLDTGIGTDVSLIEMGG